MVWARDSQPNYIFTNDNHVKHCGTDSMLNYRRKPTSKTLKHS